MKKTMFKRIFAGIAAMFMMCLCLPMCSMEFMPNAEPNTEAEDEWLDMYGIEYKIKDGDTLIINDNSFPHDYPIVLYAFYFKSYAADIKHLEIGNGWEIYSFGDLTAIESLTIGDNCTIGAIAFYGCATLTSVKIGDGCNIGKMAFWECTSLTSVKIGDDCNIGERAFWGCTSLTSVKIGDGCDIGERAFWKCTSLTSVEIGDGCTIGIWAFDDCNSIEKVTFYGGLIENVKVGNYNPEIICNKSRWTICDHDFDANHKCTICGYECTHDKFNTDHQCTICGYECDKQHTFDKEYTCTICGYFDEAALDETIKNYEAELDRLNAIKQKHGTNTTEPLTTTEEGNTASTFSNGSILAIIGGSAFLILCGLAAVIIVKRRKKTQ